MLERGWRRAGMYLYQPQLWESCCPAWTIRLKASDFRADAEQRRVVRRLLRFLEDGDGGMEAEAEEKGKRAAQEDKAEPEKKREVDPSKVVPGLGKKKDLRKAKYLAKQQQQQQQQPAAPPPTAPPSSSAVAPDHEGADWSWASSLGNGSRVSGARHTMTVEFVPARVTPESYALYEKYQRTVHKESSTQSGFKSFLVTSPIPVTPVPSSPAFPGYGTFHEEFRMDGKLFMVGVIDLLPRGLSSVYLYYDPDYAFLSPGKLSAMWELLMVKTAAVPRFQHYYMGFYIHSCQKMRYKATYKPSEVLCRDTFEWMSLDEALPVISQGGYNRISKSEKPRLRRTKSEADRADLADEAARASATNILFNNRVMEYGAVCKAVYKDKAPPEGQVRSLCVYRDHVGDPFASTAAIPFDRL